MIYKIYKSTIFNISMIEKEDISSKSIAQEQLHDLLFSREIGWQEIIYDLINTEQLDPWNVDLTILTDRYLEKIRSLEEADFFVSSKVLLAAALLLRIKSEILLNKYIKSIDEILFGKKEEKKYIMERIDFDELVPELIPKSPLPRFRRVTLQELMESLNKAIVTENRRIKREVVKSHALHEADISLPKKKFSIKDKIREIYNKVVGHFSENQHKVKVSFSDFIGHDKEERLASFSPLLHLDHQNKVWLAQDTHLEDFHIWLNDTYFKNNPDPYADLRDLVAAESDGLEDANIIEDLTPEEKRRIAKIDRDFSDPIGE